MQIRYIGFSMDMSSKILDEIRKAIKEINEKANEVMKKQEKK
jgi:hypothetical protein